MKNITNSVISASRILKFTLIFLFTWVCQVIYAQYGNIDIGIFEAASPANTIQVKLRPDFQINPIETISGILYTVRWEDPAISLTPSFISPFFVAPQSSPVLYNGFYYQIFASVPIIPIGTTINPGDEILISSFSFSGGTCPSFEIIEDDWTIANNGGVYLEFLGSDVTGSIYEPIVQFGSIGGSVTGGGTIIPGQSTGTLTLNDYSGTVLKWQKQLDDGGWVDISGTSGLVVYSEVLITPGVWDFRAEVQRGACTIEYSSPAQVIVIGASQWTGNMDDNWFQTGNWTYGTPNEYMNAIVPVVDPNPYPFVDGDWNCLNLDINDGASVTVETTGRLTVYGELINDGQFTIQSSPSGDGSFIDNGIITGSGNFRVERYIEKDKWHYISSPIADGTSGIYLDIYLKEFDEADSVWTYIVPVDIPLVPMQGYAAWASDALTGSKTVFYDGHLNTGSYAADLTNHAGAAHDSKGFNFVGNPFPSAIDWEQDAGWTKTNIDGAIYMWNPNEGFGQYGVYVYGDAFSGTNGVDSIISSGQGFFVHVSDGNTTGSLTVNNTARLHHTKPFLKSGNEEIVNKYMKIKAYSGINSYTDETIIEFGGDATPLFDSKYDAYKITGLPEAPQLYSETEDGVKLAVNTNPELTVNTLIPVGFKAGIDGVYTFEVISLSNFSSDNQILFEDKKDNILIDLKDQSIYTFFAGANDDADRFSIHFYPYPSAVNTSLANQDIYIFSSETEIYIVQSSGGILKGEFNLFDLTGRSVYTETISVIKNYKFSLNTTGVYIVSFINNVENKVFRKKVFLK